jgi:hypothetical protein
MLYRICSEHDIEIQKGYTCGSRCLTYKPLNGKSGKCVYLKMFVLSDRGSAEEKLKILARFSNNNQG